MIVAWLYPIASVLLVSVVSLLGVLTLSIDHRKLDRAVFLLVSLAVGGLFGDAFLHLLPEAYERSRDAMTTSLAALAGVFGFFVLEMLLRWRHQHLPSAAPYVRPIGSMNLVADGIHNLIDGMLIGASYLVSVPVGVATTTAVILHEIPQEIGDFGVLLHAGYSRTRALQFNFLSACLAILGAVVSLLAGTWASSFAAWMLPFTAGSFIYVAGSDLLPELHQERELSRSVVQLVAMAAGVGLMLLLKISEV
jgi:zinc and cadmium transporter